MDVIKTPYGEPVKLLIDLQGFPDGRLIEFEILKKGEKDEKIGEVNGVTSAGKGIGVWNPVLKERKETIALAKEATQQTQKEKYYFIARIDDKEIKSSDIEFFYSLDIYLQDTNNQNLDGVECSITFSDGSSKKAIFKNGHVKFEEAPSGNFKIELEKFEFIFDQ